MTRKDWIEFVFSDRRDSENFEEFLSDEEVLRFILELFCNLKDLSKYDPQEIDEGFYYIVGRSEYFHSLYDEQIPLRLRESVIDGFYPLFCEVLGPICKDDLGHLNKGTNNSAAICGGISARCVTGKIPGESIKLA